MSRGARPSPLIVAVAIVALAFLVLPLGALAIRAPWAELPRLLASEPVLQALGLSLLTGALSTLACLVLGIPLAALLAHSTGIAQRLLRAAVTIPLVLPPVVGGIALLLLLGRRGLLGQFLADAGLGIPYTTGAVVIAQTFVAMPFLVFAVEGALGAADRRTEAAAATLGASRWQVFRMVTVPLVAPGIAAGAVLCFTRALGEFGATITFAGSLPGVTRTLPIASYLALQSDPQAAIALALLLLVVSIVVLVSLRARWLPGVRA